MGTIIAIGAGLAVLAGAGAGIGIGIATSKATEAVARHPEAEGKITKILLLGAALAEATAIYGFVIALLIIILLSLYDRKRKVGQGYVTVGHQPGFYDHQPFNLVCNYPYFPL